MSYDNVIRGLVTRLEKLERGNRGLKGGGDYPAIHGYVQPLLTPVGGVVSTTSGSYTAMYQTASPDQNPSVMAVLDASVTTGQAELIIWDIYQGAFIDSRLITNTTPQQITLSGPVGNFSYMTIRTLQVQGRVVFGGGTLNVTLKWFGGKLT